MRTANINFRVKPHVDSDAPPMFAQREVHELYPTQSTAKQALSMGGGGSGSSSNDYAAKRAAAERAADAIRARFGPEAIIKGRSLR
jgi:hypothetical protein